MYLTPLKEVLGLLLFLLGRFQGVVFDLTSGKYYLCDLACLIENPFGTFYSQKNFKSQIFHGLLA